MNLLHFLQILCNKLTHIAKFSSILQMIMFWLIFVRAKKQKKKRIDFMFEQSKTGKKKNVWRKKKNICTEELFFSPCFQLSNVINSFYFFFLLFLVSILQLTNSSSSSRGNIRMWQLKIERKKEIDNTKMFGYILKVFTFSFMNGTQLLNISINAFVKLNKNGRMWPLTTSKWNYVSFLWLIAIAYKIDVCIPHFHWSICGCKCLFHLKFCDENLVSRLRFFCFFNIHEHSAHCIKWP